MNKKGISLVSLSIVIVVMIMLISTISISITYSILNAKKLTFAKEIYNIQSIVTEYIQKESVLPVTSSAIQIEPSDIAQFTGETFVDGKVLLNVLDLTNLNIKNTNYGNGEIGDTKEEKDKDIYAVSQTTGRVYYIAGFKSNDKTYYTLTDELLNMIDKKQQLTIGENTILFIPSKLGWTSEGISLKVSVPDSYEVNDIVISNANISYTTETATGITYYNVNTSKVVENYTITVKYTKNGTAGTISFTTKIDTTAPVIEKDPEIVNSEDAVKGISATDSESGIKYFKYLEGIIEKDVNLSTYMKEYGKNITKGTLNVKNKVIYTLYAEDKAGNYTLIYIDSEGNPISFTVDKSVGTSELLLNKCYNVNLRNYRIYGNSVQDGTPSIETPVEVESVGDKTVNLFSYKTLQDAGYIEIVDEKTGEFNWVNVSSIPQTDIDAKENTQYTVSADVKAAKEQMIHLTIYYTDSTYTSISATCNTETFTHITGVTEENKTIDYIKFGASGGLVKGAVFKNLQIVEGTTEKEYEPYGKYKIPIIVIGDKAKNLFDPSKIAIFTGNDNAYNLQLTDTGFSFQNKYTSVNAGVRATVCFPEPGEYILYADTSNTSASASNQVCFVMLPGYGKEYINISASGNTFQILEAGEYFITFYCSQTADVDSTTTFSNVQIEKGTVITKYEPYEEINHYNIFLDEPLRKVGDYADYIDFETGKLVRNIKEKTLTVNESWFDGTPVLTNTAPFAIYSNTPLARMLRDNDSLSNKFVGRRTGMSSVDSEFVQIYGRFIFFRVNKSRLTDITVDSFKTWLGNDSIKIYYPMETSIETTIDLPNVEVQENTNRIIVNTTLAPSKTDIWYYVKI